MYGKKPRGRPRRVWMDDITEWTGIKTYGEAKRIAEDRKRWKSMVVNLLLEDDRWMNEWINRPRSILYYAKLCLNLRTIKYPYPIKYCVSNSWHYCITYLPLNMYDKNLKNIIKGSHVWRHTWRDHLPLSQTVTFSESPGASLSSRASLHVYISRHVWLLYSSIHYRKACLKTISSSPISPPCP